ARCERGDPRRQLDRGRVRVGPVGEEAEVLGLIGTGLSDVGAAVSDVHAEQRGEPVEIALAVLVIDVAALAAHDDGNFRVVVGGHPGEVHPEMTLGQLLERAPPSSNCFLGASHRSPWTCAVLYKGSGGVGGGQLSARALTPGSD